MLIILFFLTPGLLASAWFFRREFRSVAQIADPSRREVMLLYWYALLAFGPLLCLLQYVILVGEALKLSENGPWALQFLQLIVVMYAAAKILNRYDHVRAYRRRCAEAQAQYHE